MEGNSHQDCAGEDSGGDPVDRGAERWPPARVPDELGAVLPQILQAVAGLAGHGLKDLWQHRTQFVRNTRWWPPFCATVDWVAAGILAGAILMGVPFHG